MVEYKNTRSFALAMDEQDPLRTFRDRFFIPKTSSGEDAMYFNGNSLGLQPKSTSVHIQKELDDWRDLAGEGHFKGNTPWLDYIDILNKQSAQLVGAETNEIVLMNTLSVNLHLLMVSFYRPTKERYKILLEYSAFPSDQYAVASQAKYHGFDPEDAILELKPSNGEIVTIEDLKEVMKEEGEKIALVLIGGVNYYTGQVYDMESITRIGHENGCIVGFDLAHAVGNIKLDLHQWDVDFASWCTYKYLNSGPGAIASCFVHSRYANRPDLNRFAGWWGHNKEKRFLMEKEFDPIKGARGWQLSNPPILALAGVKASLEIFDEVGMDMLVEKSKLLTGYLDYLIKKLPNNMIKIITPEERGCQLSLVITQNAKLIHQKLSQRGVFSDWREPDVIRIAPVPLYNSFVDCYRFYEILKELLD